MIVMHEESIRHILRSTHAHDKGLVESTKKPILVNLILSISIFETVRAECINVFWSKLFHLTMDLAANPYL